MKKKYLVLAIVCLFFLVGCNEGQKDKMIEYFNQNNYEVKNTCFQKTVSKDESNILQRYCLDECKYYAMDSKYDDYFTLDIQKQDINYIYDYISYQYNMRNGKVTCFFQGEEIDTNNSYCRTARQLVDQYVDLFHTDLSDADVKMKKMCR